MHETICRLSEIRSSQTAVSADPPIKELSRFLITNRISGAPVVDAHERPVGVVSLADLTAHCGGLDRTRESRYLTDLNGTDYHETPDLVGMSDRATAEQLMTTFLVRVEEETPVLEVVQPMDLMKILATLLEKAS